MDITFFFNAYHNLNDYKYEEVIEIISDNNLSSGDNFNLRHKGYVWKTEMYKRFYSNRNY